MRGRPLFIGCAVLVLAGAAALRLTGVGWLLPELVEQDPHIPIQVRLMEGAADEAPSRLDWGAYPHLVARLTQALTPRESRDPPVGAIELREQLERARWPVERVRLVVALLSILAVPATWLLARCWLRPGWSLLAAGFMGTSLLALTFGAQARAHGAAVGLDALAVLACVRLRRTGSAAAYLVAGLGVGAAIGCLQSGIATLIPLAVAHVGVVREHGRRRHALLLLPLACVVASLLSFWPFLFEGSAGEDAARLAVEQGVLEQAKHQIFLEKFDGLGFLLLGRDLWSWEPALALGALGGALVWIGARRRPTTLAARPGDRLVMLSFVLPYALVVGLYERSYERFLLPLVPFLAVLTAWGIARICEMPRSLPARRALAAALVVASLGFPVTVALRLSALRSAPSTIDLAAEWVRANVAPQGEHVLVGRSFSLPLFRTGLSMGGDAKVRPDYGLGWSSYQLTMLRGLPRAPAWHLFWFPFTTVDDLEDSLAHGVRRWVADLPADLCLNEVHVDRGTPALCIVTTALRGSSQLLARISPDSDPSAWEAPLVYQDETTGRVPPMAWRVLHAERLGPVIEIYRVSHDVAGSAPR